MLLTMDNIIPVSLKQLGMSLNYQYRYGNPRNIDSNWVMRNIVKTVNASKSAKTITFSTLKSAHVFYKFNYHKLYFYYNNHGSKQKLTLNQTGALLHVIINRLS